MPEAQRVAIIEDDASTRRLVRAWLEAEGFDVTEFASGREAIVHAGDGFAAITLDLGLDDMEGIDVLRHLKVTAPDLPVLVATAERGHETIIQAMREGAYDYVLKPLDRHRFLTSVRKAVETFALLQQVSSLNKQLAETNGPRSLVGSSPAMRALAATMQRVLTSDVVVCILGESGTGKELVARSIHTDGHRKKGAFVALNCAAIPENLQEAELFGYERGAFTGAAGLYRGRFEQADGGTLFLDEVGDMSLATQVKLLRAIQEKCIRRIGGTSDIKTNVRIVCATHRTLEAEVAAGRFREDLYFRLMVYPIETPPLRDRLEDIPQLFGHFARMLRDDVGRDITRLAPDALEALTRHRWPGNVRELQNVVRRAMLSCTSDQITLADLPPALRALGLPPIPASEPAVAAAAGPPGGVLPTLSLHSLEHMAIMQALKNEDGHIGNAAKLLGIGRSTLYRRLVAFGIDVKPDAVEERV